MHVRRIVARVSTVVVAIVVALAVPGSQLRAVSIVRECCCPDPSNCHCPDHKPDPSSQPSVRECHNSERAIVAPELPAFTAPVIAIAAAPAALGPASVPSIPAPHAAPPPPRPDAPS
ncbi:MAG TPA: hypothetical protein VFK02_16285 [Kofleriaceae bacterium]|nr:hypothetical protein [Kofleriaceae bacterium]